MTETTREKAMDAIQRIKAALAAGPTEGPWEIHSNRPDHFSIYGADGYGVGQAWNVNGAEQNHANAALMIACNPAAIREVLQTLAAKDAEIARLKLSEFAAQSAAGHLGALADELREALKEGRRAIGDHFAPDDCYATGPMTGDPMRDLVECPACSFIALFDALTQPTEQPK